MRSGFYLFPPGGTPSTTNTGVIVNSRQYYLPLTIPRRASFNRVSLQTVVAASPAGAVVRAGLYADDASGGPSALVVEFGTADIQASSGQKNIDGSWTFDAGNYWISGAIQGASTTLPTIYCTPGVFDPAIPLTSGGLTTISLGWYQDGVTAGLPTTATPIQTTQYPAYPRFGLRAA